MGSLLKGVGILVLLAAAFAAIALPGADANAEFQWWGWLLIVGVAAIGWLLLVAGSRL
ncbi:MAG: hypothetical protein ACLGI5_10035 [Thermoleophilia bacterium]